MTKHLWEINHPYYCEEHNYFTARENSVDEFNSWDHFFTDVGDNLDMDFNLIFRFDWHDSTNPDHAITQDQLLLFVMGQRKGFFKTWIINVEKTDEEKVIEFLKPRYLHMLKLWEPFSNKKV